MPQLDFTLWLINLLICWLAFFLSFTSVLCSHFELTHPLFSPLQINPLNTNWIWQ
uniref:ATP synthase complex subunit 8 n=1 Tax=Ophioplinthus gelida TaxID=696348 RepID=A0A3G2WHK3_9ECHI|nr:ATP synthase F0 subunit 8 [Ophioplinthus gelida]AYO99587.1 ATP synthase F0 subunit 8 [Ophioplinthus gelida]